MSEDVNPARVLIVDDSRMVRASIIKHIRGRYEFREEADGEAGWQALLVDPSIQLVISDIGMPQLDGYGLLERIRSSRLARVHELPVIIISGDEDDAAREKARSLGANDFIAKGIGTVELLARIDSLTHLAQARRQLEESREALSRQSPVDPVSGLSTPAYLDWHGSQELSLARRHEAEISVMAIEIDHHEDLLHRYGGHVLQLINRKLASILATKVRKEDTVAQLAPGQFAVLCPSTDVDGCAAFALRMQRTMDKIVMTYREERIRISISVGLASFHAEAVATVSELIGVAVGRAQAGRAAGGNRVVSDKGEMGAEAIERLLGPSVSIDQALKQLRAGAGSELRPRLRELVANLLPLLELIETEGRCGIPLAALARFGRDESEGDSVH